MYIKTIHFTWSVYTTLARLDYCNGVLAGLPASQLSRLQLFSTRQRDWSTASVITTMLHHCCNSCTGYQCQNEWHSNSASWCIAVCMISALNTSQRTSGSCPRFSLASDCAGPPVPTSWFLPHAGLHLATEHSQSQELECGTHCQPVSPPHHLCPHSGDSWRHFFSSDNGVNNTNCCVMVLKCLALSTTLILANWTELNTTL